MPRTKASLFPMPRDAMPLALCFADLFDHFGTEEVRYSAAAKDLSGSDVAIEGFRSHAHGPRPPCCWSISPASAPIARPSRRR